VVFLLWGQYLFTINGMAKEIDPDEEDNDSGWSSSDDYDEDSQEHWFDEDYDIDDDVFR
jgi:hypothetical protein